MTNSNYYYIIALRKAIIIKGGENMNKKEDLQNMANIMEELEGNAQQMVAAMASVLLSYQRMQQEKAS